MSDGHIGAEELTRFFADLSLCYTQKADELCALDGAIGDGDHGLTISAGFRRVAEALAQERPTSLGGVFAAAADALMSTMTGAIGPIMATFFLEGAAAVADEPQLDLPALARFVEAGRTGVAAFGGAKEGDKTLLDALGPGARALSAAARERLTLGDGLQRAAAAAAAGAEATREMAARRGRAKYVAAQGVGAVDPGAVSMALLFATLQDLVERGESGNAQVHQ